jgi:hypothetical protein
LTVTSDKRKTAQKRAAAKRKQTWKPGQSGNPAGAPKRGDSWAETIKAIGEMDGPGIAALWDTQHKEFAKLPEGITMKQLVVMTVYASLLREPSPGNWRELMERADGKVSLPVETWQDRVIALLREKKVSVEQVAHEFGADVASDLAIAAGISISEDSEARAAGGEITDTPEDAAPLPASAE